MNYDRDWTPVGWQYSGSERPSSSRVQPAPDSGYRLPFHAADPICVSSAIGVIDGLHPTQSGVWMFKWGDSRELVERVLSSHCSGRVFEVEDEDVDWSFAGLALVGSRSAGIGLLPLQAWGDFGTGLNGVSFHYPRVEELLTYALSYFYGPPLDKTEPNSSLWRGDGFAVSAVGDGAFYEVGIWPISPT